MGIYRVALVVYGVVTILIGSVSQASDLVDSVALKPCSIILGDPAPAGNCSASTDRKELSVSLTARQIDLKSHPEDAAKVTFDLPDGLSANLSPARRVTVDGLMLYNESLMPEIWQINAGATLNIHLFNSLMPGKTAATNVHTHGLLVSPDLDTQNGRALEPVGDSVYVCTIPKSATPADESGSHCAMHHAVYGTNPSEMTYRLALPSNHPEGLYWYHPHVHMNARTQVGAGLSGLIFVNAANQSSGGMFRSPATAKPPERFLMLKDIQLGNVDTSDPTGIKAAFLPADDHKADLCGTPTAGDAPYKGACFNGANGWLFTVNGQLYPSVTVKSGGKEIWRIANTSADMSYDLALVERTTGRPLRVQLLARDGVPAAQTGTNGPILLERLLVMPSSRVEFVVDRATAEGLYDGAAPLFAVLRSYGYYTGGDAWPAVDLMSVTFEAEAKATASATPQLNVTQSQMPTTTRSNTGMQAVRRTYEPLTVRPWVPSLTMPKMAALPATMRANRPVADTRRARTEGGVHNHGSEPVGANEQALPTPTDAECKPLAYGEERIIALAIDKSGKVEKFKIGTARVFRKNLSKKEWDAAVAKAVAASKEYGPGSALLCAHAGASEVWNVVNPPVQDNQEQHNFHIHQLKYEVVKVYDPKGRIDVPHGGSSAKRQVDNYPVPIGGWIRIRIGFNAQMTGGRFVFHCHILEHEDKGMMAEIEVRRN
jgi:FtsP/CotA-like multicopper oxidase with cupredoxin domain